MPRIHSQQEKSIADSKKNTDIHYSLHPDTWYLLGSATKC